MQTPRRTQRRVSDICELTKRAPLLDLFSLDRKIEAVDLNESLEWREKERGWEGERREERERYPGLLCDSRYSRLFLILSLSLSFCLSISLARSFARSDTKRTTPTTTMSCNQSILLRSLFRAAISFPLKWPDPIRFHAGSPSRSRARACVCVSLAASPRWH